jgi:hypothetical protein
MCPVPSRQLRCKFLRGRLLQTRRQELDRSALDLSQRLFAHVRQNQREVE